VVGIEGCLVGEDGRFLGLDLSLLVIWWIEKASGGCEKCAVLFKIQDGGCEKGNRWSKIEIGVLKYQAHFFHLCDE